MLDYRAIWDEILWDIKSKLSDTTYKTWFNNIKYVDFIENVFILEVPSEMNKNVISTSHSEKLADSIKDIAGENCQYFIIEENVDLDYKKIIKKKSKEKEKSKKPSNKSMLNQKYTFDEFVVGSNNQLAHAAALAVAENPGHAYNPLFIYGQVGLGKTHLIQAIAHQVVDNKESATINYVTSENFTNEVVMSIKNGKMEDVKNKYRNSDILIIDDIQFISKKEKTQEEFFHTFNDLHGLGKQIIIASDRPPHEISELEDRLRSRFQWGLICDIQAPDYETRVAILQKKAEAMNIKINDDICNYIATNIKTNIREFEGALIRISALSKLTNMPITLNMATEALKDIFTSNAVKEITPSLIKEVVCRYYNISIKEIESKKRSKNITFPRHIAMYIIRELTELAYVDIGKEFGGRDHSTLINACKKVEKEINEKEGFKKVIDKLILEIKGEN